MFENLQDSSQNNLQMTPIAMPIKPKKEKSKLPHHNDEPKATLENNKLPDQILPHCFEQTQEPSADDEPPRLPDEPPPDRVDIIVPLKGPIMLNHDPVSLAFDSYEQTELELDKDPGVILFLFP